MPAKLQLLLKEIQTLESAVEAELHRAQEKASFRVQEGKISFAKDILRLHRSLKKGMFVYLFSSSFSTVLSAPVIYAMIFPAFIMQIFCSFYQSICFPIYGIPKVERGDYIQFDRHKLAYLNSIEKMNCDFCAYFNGSLAFAREIASRTEQYWCPIRHAIAIKGSHSRYNRFVEYGDAAAYHAQLDQIRKDLKRELLTAPR